MVVATIEGKKARKKTRRDKREERDCDFKKHGQESP